MNRHLSNDHPARTHRYTTTNSGIKVFAPDQFRPREVRMSDIMDGISKICRYNGQINEFYSVAEHSVLVSRMAALAGDTDAELPALMHDVHEYVSGDYPTPHKDMVPGLVAFEDQYMETVRDALDLPPSTDPVWDRVAEYDSQILHRELIVLRRDNLPTWFDPNIEALVPTQIQPLGVEWREARSMFRARLQDLGWGLGGNL